jgi:hypothetical protein
MQSIQALRGPVAAVVEALKDPATAAQDSDGTGPAKEDIQSIEALKDSSAAAAGVQDCQATAAARKEI